MPENQETVMTGKSMATAHLGDVTVYSELNSKLRSNHVASCWAL
jgi:hypothetical protein